MNAPADDRLVWIDLEMTGLDPTACHILEIATVVTDPKLEVVAEGPDLVIHQDEEAMKTLSDWSREHFTASGLIDRSLWDNRRSDPEAIEAEFRGPKGRQWLMTWLPARAHDNGLFLIFSNGVGVDGVEIRTGNATILDPYGRVLAETWKADDDMVVADLDASLRDNCTGMRWIKTRRPELYQPLTVPTGMERDLRSVRFGRDVGKREA